MSSTYLIRAFNFKVLLLNVNKKICGCTLKPCFIVLMFGVGIMCI